MHYSEKDEAPIWENTAKIKGMWAGRLAWLGHLLDVQKVAGPNPVRPTPNQSETFPSVL